MNESQPKLNTTSTEHQGTDESQIETNDVASTNDNEKNESTVQASDSAANGQEDRSRRVYVGNLSWRVNWQSLKDFMKSHDLDATRVDVMMAPDGRSKGCAIVEFATADDARKAVLTLNDSELEGRQIFVREDREDRLGGPGGSFTSSRAFSSDHNAKSRRVYVGNLAWDVEWQDLKDFCKQAGDVVHAEIIKESGGIRSKGCGIVEFATVEGAQQAIEMLTDTDFRGRMVFVREDRETSNQNGGSASFAPNTSVFVKNLNPDTTWFQLKDYMRRAGNVDSATIHANASGEAGSGIVTYQRPQDASRAIRELNDSELMGYQISVREDRSHSKLHGRGGGRFGGRGRGAGWGFGGRGRGGRDFVGGRGDTTDGIKLFVGNLPFETSWSEVKDHFKQCGEIIHAEVKRGYGIVQFRKRMDAEKAIAEFNGTDFQGRNLEVRFDQRRW
ncbi:hypothetical protein FisN_1Hh441 [Fistulifera solaris]|uniref:RRM domain-containing protein n=1 Tax=Fistulifera solaris TaxID=1519565 RepID=A0A1Z5JJQ9_FISSO|nr:hypothetical protein FisN_1Hh441 [Fistulifera solaris]|eukprot:GAX14247.1 hypothetical protein FisN_1Hh441 [Fistulifera solaris]